MSRLHPPMHPSCQIVRRLQEQSAKSQHPALRRAVRAGCAGHPPRRRGGSFSCLMSRVIHPGGGAVHGGRLSRILSVDRSPPDDHFSGAPVARRLVAAYPGVADGSGRPVDRPPMKTAGPAPLFGLAPGGVCRARPVARPAGELLPRRFTLTAPDRSNRTGTAVCFLWHFPYPSRARSDQTRSGRWALPTTAPFGVRTFLPGTTRPPVSPRAADAGAVITPAMNRLPDAIILQKPPIWKHPRHDFSERGVGIANYRKPFRGVFPNYPDRL